MSAQPLTDDPWTTTARRLWERLEVVHTVTYFAPEVAEVHREVGLRGRTMAYTAARIAPLGPVGPGLAVATFYGFAPRVLERVLPDAWGFAAPGEVLEATVAAVARVLDGAWQGLEPTVAEAAELAREAAALHPIVGRPLAAARSALPWPGTPAAQLWEAATRMRESRGDGHLACLVQADLDGVECHLTVVGDRPRVREQLLQLRGWTTEDLDAAAGRLRDRGLLDEEGALSAEGQALRTRIEARTDELAAAPWERLGEARSARLHTLLDTLVAPIAAAGFLPSVVTRRVTG